MWWRLTILAWLCLASLRGLPAGAQQTADTFTKRTIAAVKTTQPPTIDGDLSDPAWLAAPKAETFLDVRTATPMADRTIAYLLYDDQAIYVAFDCKDSVPGGIVGRETVRDQKYQGNGGGEDDVEVVFDPFRSYRWDDFARFSVNPLGTPSARITGGRGNAVEWKGDWSAAAKRTSDGWTAELRIPWGILSYPSGKQPITMGINFWRWQERTKLRGVWSNVGPQGFNELEGLWTDVEVPATAFKPTLSLLPYVIPGYRSGGQVMRGGLDAKYTLTPQLTAVTTLNPDFGTIEGAVEGIQFSRSERFVPERRPFFLEGGDFFHAGDGYAVGDFFFSNRIRTFDLGTKVYGKLTPMDSLGLLHTLDFGRRSDLVMKLAHSFNATSDVALFLTQKSAKDDNNTVAVVGGGKRWGKIGLAGQLALSSGYQAGGGAKQLNLTYGGEHNFSSLQYLDVAPRFRDANGLIGFTDYRGFHWYNDFGWDLKKGFLRHWGGEFYTEYDWHTNGKPFRRGANLDIWLETRSDWGLGFGASTGRFEGHEDATWHLRLVRGVSNRFRRLGFGLTRGKLEDKPYSFLGPDFSIRILKRLDIAYAGAIQNFQGHEKQHILTLGYELSPTRSIGGRAVIHNSSVNWYLSFKNAGALGTQYYLMLGDPNAERFVRRLLMKTVFPF